MTFFQNMKNGYFKKWISGVRPEREHVLVCGDEGRQGPLIRIWNYSIIHYILWSHTSFPGKYDGIGYNQLLYLAVVSVALKKWTSFKKSSILCIESCVKWLLDKETKRITLINDIAVVTLILGWVEIWLSFCQYVLNWQNLCWHPLKLTCPRELLK